MRLPPWRVLEFDTLPSTQDVCRERAEAGDPGRLAIRADRQSSGRGTGGRGWQSPAGNLSLSVLLRPGGPSRAAGNWGWVAGVALAEAVESLLPATAPLGLKRPNDLMLDGRKLAGVLVESAVGSAGMLDWMVIGFGVNLAVAPELADRATACVAEFRSTPPDPAEVAGRLLERLDCWQAVLGAHGFAPVHAAWLARAHAPAGAEAPCC